jgi:hypothetical protein
MLYPYVSEPAYRADVLLIAPRAQEGELSAFIRSRRSSQDSELRIDLETYEDEDNRGTAQVLRWAYSQKHITVSLVVESCFFSKRWTAVRPCHISMRSLSSAFLVSEQFERSFKSARRASNRP